MTVHLCHQGRRLGAFSEGQVEAMLKAGVITDGTLAWTSGFAGWEPLREVLGPATPPPVPAPQTAAATTFGLTPGHSSPTDDTPKTVNVPPVIAPTPKDTRTSEAGAGELQRLSNDTRLGNWCILAWIGATVCISAVIANSNGLPQSVTSGHVVGYLDKKGIQYDPDVIKGGADVPGVLLLIAALRGVARKATATVLAKRYWQFRRFGREVYLPAVWGTLWRSAIAIFFIAVFYASIADGPVAKAQSIGVIIGIWIFTFPFTLDRPLWFKARIRYLNALSQGGTGLFSQNRTQSAPAIRGTGGSPVPRSDRGIVSLPGGGTKWVVGLSLVFAILSIIAVASVGIYVLTYRDLNRNAVETGGQDWPQSSNVVIALAQPPSGQTPAANSNLEPQLKRLGDLFPSISQYGNPQYVVKWTNFDLTARNDDLFEFVDYPATKGFIVPPSDVTVPVYSPGIGPVVQPVSPMARVGRARDYILYITDTRPGAAVVWVGGTNAESACFLLCAGYAVLGACGIADENDHEYKYLEICEGGGWTHSPSTGGPLVYLPVLCYKDRPSSDARIQSVQEIESQAVKATENILNFLDAAAAEEAKHSISNSASP